MSVLPPITYSTKEKVTLITLAVHVLESTPEWKSASYRERLQLLIDTQGVLTALVGEDMDAAVQELEKLASTSVESE
ncbi:MAG: hypothetical protein JXA33_29870 [Anaerolineae bacterium]|nr:hypothetical protein [Anaerolineae bacterium]